MIKFFEDEVYDENTTKGECDKLNLILEERKI